MRLVLNFLTAVIAMHDVIALHLLGSGQKATIEQLMGCPEEIRRLEELGLSHGATIQMVKPGRPCIIRLSGSKLCFRHNEAFHVLVRAGEVA